MTQVRETWRLYRFDTSLPCQHGHRHRLYIGISNEPLRRVLEHGKTQPWWPHVTGWAVDERVFYSEADARAAERAAILAELPLANAVHNLGNPCRMEFTARPKPPKVARRAARARTALATSRLLPAAKRAARSHVTYVAGAWLLVAGLLWWLAHRVGLSAVYGPVPAGAASAGLLLGLWAFVERDSRRGRVRFWRACSLLAVAAVVGFLVWPWIGPHLAGFRQVVAR